MMKMIVAPVVSLIAALIAVAANAERFHTSPECWEESRIYHPGPPAADLANRLHLIETPATAGAPGKPTVSPNGGYRFWVRNPDTTKEGPWGAGLIVDVERKTRPTLLFENVAQPIHPRWLNEKLIFVRVVWGRVVFSDLILDVENRKIIYHEEARDGQIAFEQFKQACGGNCPCRAPKEETKPLPVSRPGPDALIGLLEMPTIFGPPERGGVVRAENPKPVPVFSDASDKAEVLARPDTPEDFDYREIGYEQGAAVVYDEKPGWYLISLRLNQAQGSRRGWVKAADGGQFTPVRDLLRNRLSYLNEHWDGDLWSAPEAGAMIRRSPLKKAEGRQEYSVDIREARQTDHGLWLRVALYDRDPCEGGKRPLNPTLP